MRILQGISSVISSIKTVADLHSQLSRVHEQNAELRARVGQLERALHPEGELQFAEGVYWLLRDGKRSGPYCTYCYDVDRRYVHLTAGATKGTYGCALHGANFTTAEQNPPSPAIAVSGGRSIRRLLRDW